MSNFFKSIRNRIANGKKTEGLILLLLGVVLLVVLVPSKEKGTTVNGTWSSSLNSQEQLQKDTQQQLEELLGAMEGVGKVKVMLVWSSESENSICSEKMEVKGVLVLAEGAKDVLVRSKVEQMLESLFALEPHRITIETLSIEGGNE